MRNENPNSHLHRSDVLKSIEGSAALSSDLSLSLIFASKLRKTLDLRSTYNKESTKLKVGLQVVGVRLNVK